MHVDIIDRPALRIAALRHVGPYHLIGQAFGRVAGMAGPAGLFGHPGAAMVALYHDDPRLVAADRLRSDAGVVVPEGIGLPEGLSEQRVAGGRYARTTHVGGYEGLGDTWARLAEWLPASGHRRAADGVSYEHYVSDMATTPKDQLRTDIYVPLA